MPRRGWLALLPLLCCLTGCLLSEQETPSAWIKRMRPPIPASPEHAMIEVALIERPLGDAYLNKGLWLHVDEFVTLDKRSILEENGLRVGQLVGALPEEFQNLLLSKRSCSNPSVMLMPLGQTQPLYLGPVLGRTHYEVNLSKQKLEVELDQSRYCLDLVPTLSPDGKTKLSFVPKVESDEQLLPFRPSPEESSWTFKIERANKKYPELGWDVALAPGEFLIIGGRVDREKTLGQRAFEQDDDAKSVQRLLVLRNVRALTSVDLEQANLEEMVRSGRSVPLALQAAIPSVRAKRP